MRISVENVRGYDRGTPNIFVKNGRTDESRVKNLISGHWKK